MQDVFVKAWQKLEAFRGESAFSSWLHRIAVNAFLLGERGDKRRRARVETVEEPDTFAAIALTSDVGDRIDLERAIALLPQGARMAFVLHDVEGYKHEEIARMLRINIGTSKAQLHRARMLMRAHLER
jgi:RNA polymerase sigma-70 factor (ECF subfamily)